MEELESLLDSELNLLSRETKEQARRVADLLGPVGVPALIELLTGVAVETREEGYQECLSNRLTERRA
jgi:hypothetical protein